MEGELVLHCGPMKSGKTASCIIDVLKTRDVRETKTLVLCSEITGKTKIESRIGIEVECEAVDKLLPLVRGIVDRGVKAIFIDECQFFEKNDMLEFLREMKMREITVNLYGLLTDYKREVWDTTVAIMTIVDRVIEYRSFCTVCKSKTRFQIRLNGGEDKVEIEGTTRYEPRCIKHF